MCVCVRKKKITRGKIVLGFHCNATFVMFAENMLTCEAKSVVVTRTAKEQDGAKRFSGDPIQ